jgi:hypothetical protein
MSSLLINNLENNPSEGIIKISKKQQTTLVGGCYDELIPFNPFGLPEPFPWP